MEHQTISKADVFDAFADVAKAFANGRRLELIELLAQGEHSVEILASMVHARVSSVSANLQILKKASLVKSRREGTTMYYSLAGDDVVAMYLAMKQTALAHSARLRDTVDAYMDAADGGYSGENIVLTEDTTIVDVRPRIEFEAGHMEGAISIPLAELPERFEEMTRDRPVAFYCRGEFCRLAREAAAFLREHGFKAMALDEGIMEWRVSETRLTAVA